MSVREFTSAGRTMIVAEHGRADGPPIVLVHGIGMGRDSWSALGEHLGRVGRVHVLDLPGFGEAPTPGLPISMPASGAMLAEYLEVAGLTDVLLVGHSMGTQVVAEAAAEAAGRVASVVLIAPTVDDRARTGPRQAARLLRDTGTFHPRVLLLGVRYYLSAGLGWYTAKLRTMLDHRIEDTLPRVTAPTLVIRGARDAVAPRDWVARVVALLPDGVAAEVPGRGHETMMTGAGAVAALIRGHLRR